MLFGYECYHQIVRSCASDIRTRFAKVGIAIVQVGRRMVQKDWPVKSSKRGHRWDHSACGTVELPNEACASNIRTRFAHMLRAMALADTYDTAANLVQREADAAPRVVREQKRKRLSSRASEKGAAEQRAEPMRSQS